MKQFVIVLLIFTALATSAQAHNVQKRSLLDAEAHERHVTNVAGSLHGLIRAKFKFLESLFGVSDPVDNGVPVDIGHAYASDYSSSRSGDTSARSAGGYSEDAKEKVILVKIADVNKHGPAVNDGHAASPVVSSHGSQGTAYATTYAAPQVVSHPIPQSAPQVVTYAAPRVTRYTAPHTSTHAVPHATSYVPSHATPHAANYAAPHVANHYAAPQVVSHAVRQGTAYAAPHVTNHFTSYAAAPRTTYAARQVVSHAGPQTTSYAAPQLRSHVATHSSIYAAPRAATYAAPQVSNHGAIYSVPQSNPYAGPQVSHHGATYSAPQSNTYAGPQVTSHVATPTASHASQARGHGSGISLKIEKVIQKPFGGSVAGHFSVNAGINANH